MPSSPSPRDRLRRAFRPSRRPFLCALVATALLSTLFPYFENIHSANELARLYIADAIINDKTVAIDGPIRRHTHVPDKARRKGRTYSDKAPGIAAAIVVPLWGLSLVDNAPTLATKMRVARIFGATLPLLFLLWTLASFLARKRVGWRVRTAVVAALALASPLTVYGVLLFGHGLAAALIFGAFASVDAIVADGSRRDLLRCGVVGMCVGFAVAVEYPSAVFLVPAAALYAVRVTARRKERGWQPALACVAASVAGAVPFVGGVLVYHQLAFGSPLATGYAFLVNKTFANVHAQGLMGISWPKPSHFLQAFFAPNKGVFLFAPWFVLVVAPGLSRLRRLTPATKWALGGTLLLMVLFVSGMVFPGGGWTVSQRHLVPWLPFAAATIAIGCAHVRTFGDAALRILVAAGALAGFSMCFASLLVWPYLFDDLQSPVAQLIWPALLDGWRVPSTLARIGLPSWVIALEAALLLLVSVAAAIVVPRRQREASPAPSTHSVTIRGRMLAVAVALAALFVGVFVVTAPKQSKTIAKRRDRLERAYLLDPGATPIRKAKEQKSASASTASKALARAEERERKRTHQKKAASERKAMKSAEGKRVNLLLQNMSVTVDTGDKKSVCGKRDKRGKIACPQFGAGVFFRRASLHDAAFGKLATDAARDQALPRMAIRAYLPRQNAVLHFDFPQAAIEDVGGFWLVSREQGADVSLFSTSDNAVVLGGDSPHPAVRFAPEKMSTRVSLRAAKGDRELFLIPLPRASGGATEVSP